MEDLLLLVHRIPYPPNKGDKVRSFHLLRSLNKHFKVHLGCFIDDSRDWDYEHTLDSYCASRLVRPLNPRNRKLASLRGLFSGQALTVPYYADSEMRTWVRNTIADRAIKKVVVFSSSMAQFVLHSTDLRLILDLVDVDSDKWRQYAKSQSGVMKWIYQREALKLEKYEKMLSQRADKSYFVSRDEAALFTRLEGVPPEKIDYYNNGVDYQFFDPSVRLNNPYGEAESPIIVFTGAMDYWANVDAVIWYVDHVFEQVRQKVPGVKFYIVGSNPTPAIKKLGSHADIHVTGRVDDVRPYIKYASVAIAPMRIARGVQNKVLEAMSFNIPIVATQNALEGIEDCEAFNVKATDDAESFAQRCIEIINVGDNDVQYRQCILEHYDWNRNLRKVIEFLAPQQ